MDFDAAIECPHCGSTNKDFEYDNLDDLFAYGFEEPFEYVRTWECQSCGEYFASAILFTFQDLGSRPSQD